MCCQAAEIRYSEALEKLEMFRKTEVHFGNAGTVITVFQAPLHSATPDASTQFTLSRGISQQTLSSPGATLGSGIEQRSPKLVA